MPRSKHEFGPNFESRTKLRLCGSCSDTARVGRYWLWELTLPTKIPRRADISSTMCDLHVGVVILHVLSALEHDGCCHGHVVFRKLSFVYLLYNDHAYNSDYKHRRQRFTCSGVRIVIVVTAKLLLRNSLRGCNSFFYVFALSFGTSGCCQ